MAKYLIQGSYTVEGVKGLQKDKATGRKTAVSQACQSMGGKLESLYYAFGADDVVAILELPDNVAAAALSFAVASAGLVRIRTTPLMTVEEIDKAFEKSPAYRAPGR